MESIFVIALQKIVDVLNTEEIDYMIVGGFAVSYHNRARTTNDIDLIVQIYPQHVKSILKHFPDWQGFEKSFIESVKMGLLFNLTDLETGIRYDFMTFQDTDYSWAAFERREKVTLHNTKCYIASKEDLIISKLRWYNITPSEKHLEDLKFLLLDAHLEMEYLRWWIFKLKINSHGLLE